MVASSALDYGAALFPHELGDVIWPASSLAGRARPLPATERLRARPRTGGGPGALVSVAHAGFHLIEEPRNLGLLGREDAGRQTIFDPVGLGDGLVQTRHLAESKEGCEQFFPEEAAVEWEPGDGGGHEVASIEAIAPEPCSAKQHRAFLSRLGHGPFEPLHRSLVDHRPEEHIPLGGIAHPDGTGLLDQALQEWAKDLALHVCAGG